ncbi:hypothetical protein BST61_g5019 [Cercospora zeina]
MFDQEGIFGRKFRDSCNACSAQKVRCGKERPRCERCSSKDICCNYSPSLRTGRHPGSVLDLESCNPRSNVANSSNEVEGLDITIEDERVRGDRHALSNCFQGGSPWGKPLRGPADVRVSAESHVAHGCDWATMDWTRASSSQATGDWSPPRVERGNGAEHDCRAALLRLTAGQLHVASQKCLRVDGGGGDEGARCVRDVDAVLTVTREAMQLLRGRLDCVCMSDASVRLTAYMVAYKIVSLYGAIVGGSEAFGEGAGGDMVDSPVFVGSYALDTAARRSVRARAVLQEVRQHVQPAISKLPRFRAVLPSAPVGSAKEGSGPDGECMLRAEVQRVVGVARSMIC